MSIVHSAFEPNSPKTHLGEAWHRRVSGLHVLKLKGSFYEMGAQHGALLKSAIPAGPIPYFRRMVEKLMGRGVLGPLAPLVWPTLQMTVGRRVAKTLPDFARETIRGIADGAGVDPQQMLDGCTMPDSLLWLASRLMELENSGPAVSHRLAVGLGCTSALAWGSATKDGRLLHARNLDYHGVDAWPKTAAVIFHEPDAGRRYVSAAAAGVGLGGFTAMNDAGLSLTVHQHMFTHEARLGGMPIGVVGDIVMREASNLDEAEKILGSHKPIGCWTYLVSDAKTREVLCWEENPDRQAALRTSPDDDTFGYANIYLDEPLGATEVNYYGSYWRHNVGRLRRTRELLRDGRGEHTPHSMASIIGDTGDPRCRIRDSVAMVMTVASVVFRPEDGALWIGTGEAPTSRGTYVPFDLNRQDHAPEHGPLHVGADEPEAARNAFEQFRRAFVYYTDQGDLGHAREAVNVARTLAPDQPLYHALFALVAIQQGDGAAAESALDAALGVGHPDPERVAAFHLWRGRSRDLQGRRDAAVREYRAALGHYADRNVHRAARKGIDKAYTRAKARNVHIDFAMADVVSP